jgi:hypothetical protein
LLADFFNQEWGLARRTGLIDRAIPQRILALGIVAAGKEGPSFFRALLNEISSTVRLRTFHAKRERLGGFTFGIGRTAPKLLPSLGAALGGAQDQQFAAPRAVWNSIRLICAIRRLCLPADAIYQAGGGDFLASC